MVVVVVGIREMPIGLFADFVVVVDDGRINAVFRLDDASRCTRMRRHCNGIIIVLLYCFCIQYSFNVLYIIFVVAVQNMDYRICILLFNVVTTLQEEGSSALIYWFDYGW